MNNNHPKRKPVFSQQGQARKDAMLETLQRELSACHRQRRRRRVVVKGTALIVLFALIGFVWMKSSPNVAPERKVVESTLKQAVRPRSRATVALVSNLNDVEQLGVVTNSSDAKLERLTDEDLLATLAAAGMPSVLVEIDGQVRLIPDSGPVLN